MAAPTTGLHQAGEYRRNKSAAVGEPVGYVCTASGEPGTWKAVGYIGDDIIPSGDSLAVQSGGEVDFESGSALKIGGAEVTASADELNKMDGVPYSVTVAVTTPGASGTCDAAFTFKDAAGVAIAFAVALPFYLSGSTGLAVTAAITGIAAADTPVGGVVPLTTGQSGMLVTTAAGLASLKLDGVAATTYYITFVGPGGRLIVSPALLTKA